MMTLSKPENTSGLLQLLEMQLSDTHGRGEAGGILYLHIITGVDIINVLKKRPKALATLQDFGFIEGAAATKVQFEWLLPL